jgi:hypothetical protein
MSIPRYSLIHLVLAAVTGAAVSYAVFALVLDDKDTQRNQIAALEQKIQALELAQRPPLPPVEDSTPKVDIEQMRKDLSTRFIGDARTFGEKLQDFVTENAYPQTIPLACKVVADLGDNLDTLTNPELNSLYQHQSNTEFKRVVAQVLSARGDNSLLEKYVAEAKPVLNSTDPAERRKILGELAKTRYVGAANAIAPLVKDRDTSVQLDALLALRATGNETHIRFVAGLVKDPDESVQWLATDAINHLQNLSKKARTKLTSADIEAELPPLTP